MIRCFLLAISLLVPINALADIVAAPPGRPPPLATPSFYITTLIDYGQSWDSNCWSSFSALGINPQAGELITPHYTNPTTKTINGPLPSGAGISIPGNIDGVTSYQSSDCVSIGRSAILAQQIYRQFNSFPITPLMQWGAAYPGSTWTTGAGGGLAPGASVTASITSNEVDVSAVASGVVWPGQKVVAAGVPSTFRILAEITGTGGIGSYLGGIAQTIASTTLVMANATVVGSIGGAAPDTTFTVTQVISGTVTPGDTLPAPALANTTIQAYGTQGTTGAGGIGTYFLVVGTPTTVGSEPVQTNGVSWANQLSILSQINSAGLPRGSIEGAYYSAVEYTQGGSADNTLAGKVANLTEMFVDYDALGITAPGRQLFYYLQVPSATSNSTTLGQSILGTIAMCGANLPSGGGTYSGRVYCTNPSYAWQFVGTDNIHTGLYGTARWAESLGYVRNQVEDLGNVNFTPFWRTPGTSPVVDLIAQTITLHYSKPNAPDFANATPSWQSSATDGIKVWPQYGFDLKDSGVDCAVSPAIVGNDVVLTATGCTMKSSDALEISYAFYGPGGPSPGTNSGVGGNLAIAGPASALFPGESLIFWAMPSDETLVVP